MADDSDPGEVFDLGLGFMRSKAVLSAVRLGVFAELTAGSLDRATLAERTGVHERAAADFFDALVAVGALEREDGVYRNADAVDRYLDPDGSPYVGDFFAFADGAIYRGWAGLTDALQTGEPQTARPGPDAGAAYDDLYGDDRHLAFFLNGMSGLSAVSADAIARRFPWDEYDSLCDLGTSKGRLPIGVADRHDHLDVVGLDLPPVESHFAENVAAHGLSDRVRFEAADFFEDPLPAADVYVLGHILHNWDDDARRTLLGTVYDALPEDGALIVYGTIVDDDRRENALALLMSLNMLVTMESGSGYTFAECEQWLDEVGFSRSRRENLPGPDSMIVAEK